MKTLKITAIATLASMVAWWLHFPHRIWPEHPQFLDFLLALVLCVVLQFAWSDAKDATRKG
jgi:hypothetical protein